MILATISELFMCCLCQLLITNKYKIVANITTPFFKGIGIRNGKKGVAESYRENLSHEKLIQGIHRSKPIMYPPGDVRATLQGQHPRILFITCSDSGLTQI